MRENALNSNKNKEDVALHKDDFDDFDDSTDIKSIFDDAVEEKWENEINDYLNTKRAQKDENILQW